MIKDCEFQNENLGKSATKLPPLRQPKQEEASQDRTPELGPPPNLERKFTEQADRKGMVQSQNTYIIKKVNQKRKVDKRKNIEDTLRPELVHKYNQYMNFLSYINLSNNLKVHNGPFEKPYKFHVGRGNNGTLIKNLFRNNRPWWTLEDDLESNLVNLQWFQLRQNHVLDDLKNVSKV